MLPGWDIAVDVTPAALETTFARAADAGTPARAALIVSPTYFGTTSDIPGTVHELSMIIHWSVAPYVECVISADAHFVGDVCMLLTCRTGVCVPPSRCAAAGG